MIHYGSQQLLSLWEYKKKHIKWIPVALDDILKWNSRSVQENEYYLQNEYLLTIASGKLRCLIILDGVFQWNGTNNWSTQWSKVYTVILLKHQITISLNGFGPHWLSLYEQKPLKRSSKRLLLCSTETKSSSKWCQQFHGFGCTITLNSM